MLRTVGAWEARPLRRQVEEHAGFSGACLAGDEHEWRRVQVACGERRAVDGLLVFFGEAKQRAGQVGFASFAHVFACDGSAGQSGEREDGRGPVDGAWYVGDFGSYLHVLPGGVLVVLVEVEFAWIVDLGGAGDDAGHGDLDVSVHECGPWAAVPLVHVGRLHEFFGDFGVGFMSVGGLFDGLFEDFVFVFVDLVAADFAGFDESSYADGDGSLSSGCLGCEEAGGPCCAWIVFVDGAVEREGSQCGDGHGPGASDFDALRPFFAVDARVAEFFGEPAGAFVGEGVHVAAFDHDGERVWFAVGDPPCEGAVHLLVGGWHAAALFEDGADAFPVGVERVVGCGTVGGLFACLGDEVDDPVEESAFAAVRVEAYADEGESVVDAVFAVFEGEESLVAFVEGGAGRVALGCG